MIFTRFYSRSAPYFDWCTHIMNTHTLQLLAMNWNWFCVLHWLIGTFGVVRDTHDGRHHRFLYSDRREGELASVWSLCWVREGVRQRKMWQSETNVSTRCFCMAFGLLESGFKRRWSYHNSKWHQISLILISNHFFINCFSTSSSRKYSWIEFWRKTIAERTFESGNFGRKVMRTVTVKSQFRCFDCANNDDVIHWLAALDSYWTIEDKKWVIFTFKSRQLAAR